MAGAKTEMVKEALVRHIVDEGLECGDKLPSQNELRLKLNVGSTTISNAIKSLAEDNVLELRDKVGVFVKKHGLDGHTGRNVGILVNVSNSIYVHILVSRLQKSLQENNCNTIIFSCPADKDSKRLRNYPGLVRSIRQKAISSLLITCELFDSEHELLAKSEIKTLSCWNCGEHPSCHIDMQRYLREAFEHLVDQGARRPALLSRGYTKDKVFEASFAKLLAELDSELDCREYYLLDSGFFNSREVVMEFLARPDELRPDAFIFTGDVIMQGIQTWLFRLQTEQQERYMPLAAAILNKQNPMMPLADNVAVFELDIFEQADAAVEILLEAERSHSRVRSAEIPARLVSQEKYFENSMANQNIDE
jgi:DNA-binding LacI/PurR family transcriptional regulator